MAEEERQRITSVLDGQRLNRKRRLNPVKASLRRVGNAFNGSKVYAKEKVSSNVHDIRHDTDISKTRILSSKMKIDIFRCHLNKICSASEIHDFGWATLCSWNGKPIHQQEVYTRLTA